MKTISSIKKDMEFNQGLSSLIEILKSIAVQQFRVLEHKIRVFEQLAITIESFFDLIDVGVVNHPFVQPQNKPQAVVAVTSDSGLLGGLNRQVIAQALYELEKIPGRLIVIGERGKLYAQEVGVSFVGFPGVVEEESYGQAMQLRDYCLQNVLQGAYGHLKVVYPRPVSFTVQKVEMYSFLPYVPAKREDTSVSGLPRDVIIESRLGDIMEYLVSVWVGQKFYEVFGLSRLAEFAARFVHLEESQQRLKEMDVKIRREYFRVRHEIIDRNMRELFAARISYAH